MKTLNALVCALALGAVVSATPALAGPRENIIAAYAAQGAGAPNPANGQAMYTKNYGTGKPDTPQCTSCHGATPQQGGQTRTGKPIDPLAVSRTPDRFTDPEKVEKWFGRNCNSVIGRDCTPQEKVDFLTYMISQ